MFPLVDIDWDPQLRTHTDAPNVPVPGASQPSTSNNNTPAPSNGGRGGGQHCSIDPADSTCIAPGGAEASEPPSVGEGAKEAYPGFPLKGFLRVELVRLEEAEVTFRPGEARGAALIAEREKAAAEEEKVFVGESGRENVPLGQPQLSFEAPVRMYLSVGSVDIFEPFA